jgi:hypothetical protein
MVPRLMLLDSDLDLQREASVAQHAEHPEKTLNRLNKSMELKCCCCRCCTAGIFVIHNKASKPKKAQLPEAMMASTYFSGGDIEGHWVSCCRSHLASIEAGHGRDSCPTAAAAAPAVQASASSGSCTHACQQQQLQQ